MPLDTLALAAVLDELESFAVAGRIQKIIQPSESSVGLAVYNHGRQRWLLLSASAEHARVHFTEQRLSKAFATPSPFVMLLRKYIEGARIQGVYQQPGERILRMDLTVAGQSTVLVAEIMGKHSNVLLLGPTDVILGALKIVPPRKSRARPILPGQLYSAPPAQPRDTTIFPSGDRLDAAYSRAELAGLLATLPSELSVAAALRGILRGASPFMIREIVKRAQYPELASMADSDLTAIIDTAASLFSLFASRRWEACTFVDDRARADFAPYIPCDMNDVQPISSISAAIEKAIGDLESRDALKSIRTDLQTAIHREIRSLDRKQGSLEEGLRAAAAAEEVKEDGQLILAYMHRIDTRADRLELPEYGRAVQLDPRSTPPENAARFFRRYRKLRDARERIPPLLEAARREKDRLVELLAFVRLAESEADLRDLRRDVSTSSVSGDGADRKKAPVRRGPSVYQFNGFSAIAGRNARENEEVTFKLARRGELWFHCRGRTGAHVVLRAEAGTVPDDVLYAAAGLAGYLSEGRQDTRVDVDVTEVKNIRKVSGSAPGRVTYHGARSLSVVPSRDPWELARKSK